VIKGLSAIDFDFVTEVDNVCSNMISERRGKIKESFLKEIKELSKKTSRGKRLKGISEKGGIKGRDKGREKRHQKEGRNQA